jgi:hypothetical protein
MAAADWSAGGGGGGPAERLAVERPKAAADQSAGGSYGVPAGGGAAGNGPTAQPSVKRSEVGLQRPDGRRWSGCSNPQARLQRSDGGSGVWEEAAARLGEGGGVQVEAAARVSGSEKNLGSDYHIRGMEWIAVQWMIVLLHMGYII